MEGEPRLLFQQAEGFGLVYWMKFFPDEIFNQGDLKRVAINDEGTDCLMTEQPARVDAPRAS